MSELWVSLVLCFVMKNVTPGHPDADAAAAYDAALPPEAGQRLRRLRKVAWVLDRIIPIGGGRRVGIDPLIGLIPGAGDWIASLLSVYILYEAARLGLPSGVLARIAFNIALEGIIGTVPIAGDLFDFIFQANMRNLRLVERYYRPEMRPRSFAHIWLAIAAFTFALLAFLGFAIYAMIKVLWMLFTG